MFNSLIYVLEAVNFISMIHLGLYVVGANTYDILQLKKGNKPEAGLSGDEPLVSVVIPAHNEAKVISRTLNSVRASSYKNIEIIVVDDGSHDKTVKIVRDYVSHLPTTVTDRYLARHSALQIGSKTAKRELSLRRRFMRAPTPRIRTAIFWQINAGKAAAMNNAIENHVRGELVMCLDADSMLHPKAIERAVRYFKDPQIIGVAANVRVMEHKSWLSTLQRFEHMVGYRAKKFYSLTNSEFIIGGVASTYRTAVLKAAGLYDTDTLTEDIGLSLKLIAAQGNRSSRIVYAADVVAMTEGVQTFKALLRQRYRWKMGSLQNLFKYRHMIGNRDHEKYSYALTAYRLPMAVVSEVLLMMEPLLLAYIIYLSVHYHTFGILVGAYITITGYVMWTLWPDEHLSLKQKLRLSVTALGIYGLFYVMDVVQIYAIFRCLINRGEITHRQKHVTWISPARSGQLASFKV